MFYNLLPHSNYTSLIPHIYSMFFCSSCMSFGLSVFHSAYCTSSSHCLLFILHSYPPLFYIPPSYSLSSPLLNICRAQQNAAGFPTHNLRVWCLVAVLNIVPDRCLIILWHAPHPHQFPIPFFLSAVHYFCLSAAPQHQAFTFSWMEGEYI